MNIFTTIQRRLWPKKIRSQLILGIVLVHLVLMSIFVFDLVRRQRAFLKKQNLEQLKSFVNNYASGSEAYVVANDFEGLEQLTRSHGNFPNLRYAMILSADGSVLAHTNTKYIGSKLTDSISTKLKSAGETSTLIENDDIADIAVPIMADDKVIGWARAGVGQDYIKNNLSGILLDGLIYIIIALVAGAFFAVLIGSKLSKGLYKLVSAAHRIKNGDRNTRVAQFRGVELAELGTAFNKMLDEISANERLLSMVIENLPVGLWILNERGEIVSSNPAGKKLWGGAQYAGIEDYGLYRGWFTDTKKLIEPHEWAAARAIEKGETVLNEEIEIETVDEKRKTILHSALPLKDMNGNIMGAVAMNMDISDRKRAENELHKINHDIGERVKELRCLYRMSQLSNDANKTMEDILEDCAGVIPPSYQYPEITCARITFEGKVFESPCFIETVWKQEANIISRSVVAGKVQVYYKEQMPTEVEGPFLREERLLINSIADILGSAAERKKIITQLALSESTLRGAFEYSAIGMAIVSLEGKFTKVNPELCNMLGYTEEELLSLSIKEITYPETLNNDIEFIEKARQKQIDTYRTEKRYYHKNGSLTWINLNSSVVKDNDGNPLYFISQMEDITEKKRVSDQLKESELKFKNLVEKSLVGVYIIQKGKFVYVNPRLAKDLRYTQEELLNMKDAREVVYKDDMDVATEQWRKRAEEDVKDIHVELRYRRKDGEVIWAEVNSTQTYYQGEKATIGTCQDVTDRKNSEVIIKEQAETFGAIIENTNESILLISPQFKVLQFNKTAGERIAQNRGKELYTGADLKEFLYAGSENEFLSMFNDALAGKYAEVEVPQTNKDGEVFWLRTRMYPIYETNKKLKGVTVLGENITERKKAERSILHFSRLYQFTSAINEMMLRTESKKEIFSEACEIAIRDGKFSMAWIGNISAGTRKIEPFAWAGNNDGYLENLRISVGEEDFARGAAGHAIRDRKPFCCNDVATDTNMLPWRDEALKRGYRSLISLPIIVGAKLEAVFTFYTPEAFFFNDEEVKLLQEVINNIAYAIEKLELKELQKRSEQELKESEEKFRKLVEETSVGVFILQDGRFAYVNPQFEKISGFSQLELLSNMSFEQLIHKDDLQRVWKKYLARVTGGNPSDHYFLKAVRKDKAVLQIEVIVSTITYKGKPAIIATVIDITEQFEEEKRINKAVTDAQERERQQISMELHDNVKQIMAASLLNIDYMKMTLKDEKTTIQIIDNVKSYIREAIDELRRISHQLAPSIDGAVPLEEKIKTVVNTMNVSNKISVSYSFDKLKKPLKEDMQLAMYRILQEQFSNILKYAKASEVDIAVQKRSGDICMSIRDNGVGFNTQLKKGGIGLENIKRRAQVLSGEVNIESSPGNGCRLEVNIPFK